MNDDSPIDAIIINRLITLYSHFISQVFKYDTYDDEYYSYKKSRYANNLEDNDEWEDLKYIPTQYDILNNREVLTKYLVQVINHEIILQRTNSYKIIDSYIPEEDFNQFCKKMLLSMTKLDDFSDDDREQVIYDLGTIFIHSLRRWVKPNKLTNILFPKDKIIEKSFISIENNDSFNWKNNPLSIKFPLCKDDKNFSIEDLPRPKVIEDIVEVQKELILQFSQKSFERYHSNKQISLLTSDHVTNLMNLFILTDNSSAYMIQLYYETMLESLIALRDKRGGLMRKNTPSTKIRLITNNPFFIGGIYSHNGLFNYSPDTMNNIKSLFSLKINWNKIDKKHDLKDNGKKYSIFKNNEILRECLDYILPFCYIAAHQQEFKEIDDYFWESIKLYISCLKELYEIILNTVYSSSKRYKINEKILNDVNESMINFTLDYAFSLLEQDKEDKLILSLSSEIMMNNSVDSFKELLKS